MDKIYSYAKYAHTTHSCIVRKQGYKVASALHLNRYLKLHITPYLTLKYQTDNSNSIADLDGNSLCPNGIRNRIRLIAAESILFSRFGFFLVIAHSSLVIKTPHTKEY